MSEVYRGCNIRKARKLPKLDDKIRRRFLRYVWRGPETDCWIWIGSRTLGGYGQMRILGIRSKFLAHRISFELFSGHARAGSTMMHLCDNPQCVNPDHLREGTAKKNAADMIAKGRRADGRGH